VQRGTVAEFVTVDVGPGRACTRCREDARVARDALLDGRFDVAAADGIGRRFRHDCADGQPLRPQVFLRGAVQVAGGRVADRVEVAGLDPVVAAGELETAELVRDAGHALALEVLAREEVEARALEFFRGDGFGAQTLDLTHRGFDRRRGAVDGGFDRDGGEPGVARREGAGVDAVGEALAFLHVPDQTAAVATPEDEGQQVEVGAVGVVEAHARVSEFDVRAFEGARPDSAAQAALDRLLRAFSARGARLGIRERDAHLVEHRFVLEIPHRDDCEIVRTVPALEERAHAVAIETRDAFRCSEDWRTIWMDTVGFAEDRLAQYLAG